MYKSIVIILILIFSCNFASAAVTDQEVEDFINGLNQEQLDRIHKYMAEHGFTREEMIEMYKIQKESEEGVGPTMTLEEYYSKKKTDETALAGASQSTETIDPSVQGIGQTAMPAALSEIGQMPSAQQENDIENKYIAEQEKTIIAEPKKSGIINQGSMFALLFIFCILNFFLTLSILLAKKKEVFTIKA